MEQPRFQKETEMRTWEATQDVGSEDKEKVAA